METAKDYRAFHTAVNLQEEKFSQMKLSEAKTKSMFSWNSSNRTNETSKRQSILNTEDIEWSEKEIKQSRQFAVKHINIEKNAYEEDQ